MGFIPVIGDYEIVTKHLYLDLETTGLDPKTHAVIQIAGIIEIDGEAKEEFNFFVKPFPNQLVSQEALLVHGIAMEDIKKFPSPKQVYHDLVALFGKYVDKYKKEDKFWIVAYNANFDQEFLREFFKNNGDEYFGSWCWWPAIDVAILFAEIFKDQRGKFRDFKLATLCEHLKIDLEAHDALSDVKATRNLYLEMYK